MKLLNSIRLGLAASALLLASTLSAAPVSFSTTGVFSTSGTNTATFGAGPTALTLTFSGVNSNVDTAPFGFTFTSFGTIQSQSASTTDPQPISGTFTLNIAQTVPSGGVGTLMGSLSGAVDFDTSTGILTVTTGPAVIGDVTYQFTQTEYSIVPPTTNSGRTTLQGRVELLPGDVTIPEPSTYALLGSGILAIVGLSRRIRKS